MKLKTRGQTQSAWQHPRLAKVAFFEASMLFALCPLEIETSAYNTGATESKGGRLSIARGK
jgi:hypothetical protein